MFGDRMVAVALAFAVLDLGGGPAQVGYVLAARTFALATCVLAGGVVADRVSRRAVMVVTDVVRLVSQGLLAGLLIAGAPALVVVAVLAGVTGGAAGFGAPASTGLLPELIAPEDLQEANGLRATAFSAGELGGPLLSGALVAAAGAGWALAVDAATFVASAALLVRVRAPARTERAARSFVADLREGWSGFRSRRWVWTFVAWASLGNLVFGAWKVLGPVVAKRELGGAAVWGSILASQGVGAVVGGVVALRARPRRPLLLCAVTGVFFAAPVGALAATRSPVVVGAGALLAGVSLMIGNTLFESTLQSHIPRDVLSRVSAYDWFGSLVLDPAGLAIWGPIAGVIGIQASLWLAFALLLGLGVALLAVPEVRSLPPAPDR